VQRTTAPLTAPDDSQTIGVGHPPGVDDRRGKNSPALDPHSPRVLFLGTAASPKIPAGSRFFKAGVRAQITSARKSTDFPCHHRLQNTTNAGPFGAGKMHADRRRQVGDEAAMLTSATRPTFSLAYGGAGGGCRAGSSGQVDRARQRASIFPWHSQLRSTLSTRRNCRVTSTLSTPHADSSRDCWSRHRSADNAHGRQPRGEMPPTPRGKLQAVTLPLGTTDLIELAFSHATVWPTRMSWPIA
jgi:hypothetical protein